MGEMREGFLATDPAGGLVDVTVTAFDADQRFSDCSYIAADSPSAGDRCLVLFDDDGGTWALIPNS